MELNTNKSTKNTKKMTKLHKVALILFGIAALIIFISILSPKSDTTKKEDTDVKTSALLSENDAEVFCQDAALIGKYLDMNKIKVIDVLSYNKYFTETGDKDSSGNNIMQLTWNGKQSDETLGFTCWVSGAKENIILHKLSVNGKVLYSL